VSDNKVWLAHEIDEWIEEGLIDRDRAQSILSRYEMAGGARLERDQGRLITVLSVMGALLVGIGGILFIAANWEAMTRATKVAIIFASILGSSLGGYSLSFGNSTLPRVGHSLMFLSNLLFGAGIWLIAQAYHIQSHYPNGILTWGIGVLAMAWAIESSPSLVLAGGLLTLWTGTESLGGDPWHINVAFLPLIGLVVAAAYRLKSTWSLVVSLGGLTVWSVIVVQIHTRGTTASSCISGAALILVALTMLGTGALHDRSGPYAIFRAGYRQFAAVLLLGTLYGLTFLFMLDGHFFRWHDSWRQLTDLAVLVPGVLICLGLLLSQKTLSQAEWYGTAGMVGLAAVLSLLPFVPTTAWLPSLVVNLSLVAGIVLFIWIGYQQREPALFNVGMGFFALDLVTRYFDWFWEFLPRSLFFMAGGIVLLVGGAYLERTRRKVLADWKEVER